MLTTSVCSWSKWLKGWVHFTHFLKIASATRKIVWSSRHVLCGRKIFFWKRKWVPPFSMYFPYIYEDDIIIFLSPVRLFHIHNPPQANTHIVNLWNEPKCFVSVTGALHNSQSWFIPCLVHESVIRFPLYLSCELNLLTHVFTIWPTWVIWTGSKQVVVSFSLHFIIYY